MTGTKGDVHIDRAFSMKGPMASTLTVDGRPERIEHPAVDQFAAELVYFSNCILEGHDPQPCGIDGLADLRIAEALRRSSRSGRPVPLDPIEPPRRPDPAHALSIPPANRGPELIKVKPPFSQHA